MQHSLAQQRIEAVLEVDAEDGVELVPERGEEVSHALHTLLSAEPQLDVLHLLRRVLRRRGAQRTLEGPLEQRRADVDRPELGLEPARGSVCLLLGALLVQREQPSAGEHCRDTVGHFGAANPRAQPGHLAQEGCVADREEEVRCPAEHVQASVVQGSLLVQEALGLLCLDCDLVGPGRVLLELLGPHAVHISHLLQRLLGRRSDAV